MLSNKVKGIMLMSTSIVLAACGGNGGDEVENTTLGIASHLPPMTDIVEIAAENIAEPYTIELNEVTDNVQYNVAVQNKESYASFAQHEPFMESFNEANDGNLTAIQTIYDPIVGFYSPVYDSMEEIEDGAEIAIPNDVSNQARALLVLAEHDLIEVDENVNPAAVSIDDVTSNPYDFKFTLIDLLNLSAAYEDGVDLVFNLPTYIANVGLTPDDALFLESEDQTLFALTVVIHEDNKDSEATQALIDAFTSQAVYDYLTELSDVNHLYPAFDAPTE